MITYTLESLRNSNLISREDHEQWAFVSEILIEHGKTEPITDVNILAYKIKALAEEIAALSFHCAKLYDTEEEMDEGTQHFQEKLDEKLLEISFGSKIHPDIIDPILSAVVEQVTEELLEELSEVRRVQGDY